MSLSIFSILIVGLAEVGSSLKIGKAGIVCNGTKPGPVSIVGEDGVVYSGEETELICLDVEGPCKSEEVILCGCEAAELA